MSNRMANSEKDQRRSSTPSKIQMMSATEIPGLNRPESKQLITNLSLSLKLLSRDQSKSRHLLSLGDKQKLSETSTLRKEN